jgi:type VI secretion system protein
MKSGSALMRHFHSTFLHILHVCLFLLLVGLLASCSITTRTRALLGSDLQVNVHASEEMNQRSPVALELLLVYNKTLLGELKQMSASTWFEQRDQVKDGYLAGKDFDSVLNAEVVPGHKIYPYQLPLKAKARAGVIFANYFSDGVHRRHFDPRKNFRIDLDADNFYVKPLE